MFDKNQAEKIRDDVRWYLLDFLRENIGADGVEDESLAKIIYDIVGGFDRLASLPPKPNRAMYLATAVERAYEAFRNEFNEAAARERRKARSSSV